MFGGRRNCLLYLFARLKTKHPESIFWILKICFAFNLYMYNRRHTCIARHVAQDCACNDSLHVHTCACACTCTYTCTGGGANSVWRRREFRGAMAKTSSKRAESRTGWPCRWRVWPQVPWTVRREWDVAMPNLPVSKPALLAWAGFFNFLSTSIYAVNNLKSRGSHVPGVKVKFACVSCGFYQCTQCHELV